MTLLDTIRRKLGKPKRKGKKPKVLQKSQKGTKKKSASASSFAPGPRPGVQRRKRKRTVKSMLKTRFGIAFLVPVIVFLAWFTWGLPNINDLNKSTKTPSVLIKTEKGDIIGSFGDIYGEYLSFDALPSSLIDAVMATEDRNFYYHFGIDPLGLIRATFVNVKAGHVVQGGSTITQQVAKNVFLTSERSFMRKLKEMLLAIKLEFRFTKKEILSIYLNRVYLGAGNFGVDAAAHRYFDKSARELTLSESAILAGLLKAPSRYAPTSNPTQSRERASVVLANMEDAGFLKPEQTKKAKEELVRTMNKRRKSAQSMQYFSDWIVDQLQEYVGTITEDVEVVTTIDPELQRMGEKAVNDVMDKEADSHLATQAALLSMSPDGAIRVMIGGRDYGDSQYNRATQAMRQPGSSFKLFVYLAGLEDGLGPDSMVEDQPIGIKIVGGVWHPKNYTNKYLGAITLRSAVKDSVNTVAVQVAQASGFGKVVEMARRLGITSDMQPLPSIALGATEVTLLELTNAYAHMAANGAIVKPYGILEIKSVKGKLLYQRQPQGEGQVLRAGVVGMMNSMLMNVVEDGTGRSARIGRPAAGKTGTTSDYRDAWFVGYTPDLVAGVWVGNDDNKAMKKVTGGTLPAQIWHNYMIAALANVPVSDLPTASGGDRELPWMQGDMVEMPVGARDLSQQQKEDKPDQPFWDGLLR